MASLMRSPPQAPFASQLPADTPGSTLFAVFLHFFGAVLDASHYAVNVRAGALTPRTDAALAPTSGHGSLAAFPFIIMDPFNLRDNPARNINAFTARRLRRECLRALCVLAGGGGFQDLCGGGSLVYEQRTASKELVALFF
jgi:hypothetical protein